MYYCSIPLAIALSVVVLDEQVTWNLIVGTSLILIGNCFGISQQIKNKSFFIEAAEATTQK